jgi:hypothetical protein
MAVPDILEVGGVKVATVLRRCAYVWGATRFAGKLICRKVRSLWR